MLDFSKFKVTFILLICLLFVWLALPNFLNKDINSALPDWFAGDTVNLGLDLRGGSHILLEVDFQSYLKEQYQNLRGDVRSILRENDIGYRNVRVKNNSVVFTLRRETMTQDDSVDDLLKNIDYGLDYKEEGDLVTVTFSEAALTKKRLEVLSQSIEIVNRRINETGLTEPTIQRQGDSRIIVQVPGLDDPERLKKIIGKTAKMTFHLVNTEVNYSDIIAGVAPLGTRIIAGDKADSGEGGEIRKYAVFNRVELSGELLTNASMTYDTGRPVVSFRFNAKGAKKFGEITRKNTGKPFAIVLDGKVITAPRINGAILGGSGIITGNFTAETAADLALLLRAGALPAPLTIVEERTVGPSLGSDSIAAGKKAAMIAVIAVMVFMILSYGLFGLFSNIALAMNLIILLGVLSLFQATLTLPGVAGIVLTLGMAVDANVLIFERIREEISKKKGVLQSLDSGFKSAFGTIIDSNITTLLAAFVLYYFGTGTVRGFAVTLSIGILASMFSAILLTRMMVVLWAKKTKPTTIPI